MHYFSLPTWRYQRHIRSFKSTCSFASLNSYPLSSYKNTSSSEVTDDSALKNLRYQTPYQPPNQFFIKRLDLMEPEKSGRIRVSDLLNEAPARGKPSHRPTPLQSNIFTIVCNVENCGRRFATKEALQGHQKRSHMAPTQYLCQQCSSTFSSSANLNKHVRFISKISYVYFFFIKTYSTTLTKLTFIELFTKIRSVHNKLKPFKCSICGSTFGFKDGLERHIKMVHEQARPHICEHCSFKFKTKAHLKSHQLALHPEKLERKPKMWSYFYIFIGMQLLFWVVAIIHPVQTLIWEQMVYISFIESSWRVRIVPVFLLFTTSLFSSSLNYAETYVNLMLKVFFLFSSGI